MSKRWTGRRGQAAVEFALLLPILMLLTLGAVDFGRLMYGVVTVNNAAFHSALWAVANLHQGAAGCGSGSSSSTYCCPTANNTTTPNTVNPNEIREVVIRDFLVGMPYTSTCPSSDSTVGTTCNPAISCSTAADGQTYSSGAGAFWYADVTVTYQFTTIGPYSALLPSYDISRTSRVRRVP
jgi:Flp pilus assembly protein TadG